MRDFIRIDNDGKTRHINPSLVSVIIEEEEYFEIHLVGDAKITITPGENKPFTRDQARALIDKILRAKPDAEEDPDGFMDTDTKPPIASPPVILKVYQTPFKISVSGVETQKIWVGDDEKIYTVGKDEKVMPIMCVDWQNNVSHLEYDSYEGNQRGRHCYLGQPVDGVIVSKMDYTDAITNVDAMERIVDLKEQLRDQKQEESAFREKTSGVVADLTRGVEDLRNRVDEIEG